MNKNHISLHFFLFLKKKYSYIYYLYSCNKKSEIMFELKKSFNKKNGNLIQIIYLKSKINKFFNFFFL